MSHPVRRVHVGRAAGGLPGLGGPRRCGPGRRGLAVIDSSILGGELAHLTARTTALAGLAAGTVAERPMAMAVEALHEALLRLGMPLTGQPQDPQNDPLVLGVEPGVGADQRFDGGFRGPVGGVAGDL